MCILSDWLLGLGVIGVFFLIICLVLLPLFLTVVLGITIANMIGFTGLSWWAFVILFYIIVTGIIGVVS